MFSIHYNDDASYAAALRSGVLYVYNDFPGSNSRYRKLHRFDCRTLRARPGLKKTSVRKVCSDTLDELVHWLLRNRGGEGEGYTVCPVCLGKTKTPSRVAQISSDGRCLPFPARSLAARLIAIYRGKKTPSTAITIATLDSPRKP